MQARMPLEQRATHLGTVSRETFVRCFLDALADAANLEPTLLEVARLFQEMVAEEAGNTPTSRFSLRTSIKTSMSTPRLSVPYERLHMSPTLTSFLSDMQIYGIVSRFKKKQREEGGKVGEISQEEFVEHYPRFLREVMRPDFTTSLDKPSKSEGLDVAFQHLCLAVKVGKDEVNVLDDVTGRFCSRTMVAVMGGTGSGKSSLLNALCGRAYYGKVSGKVFVNGNEAKIEEQKGVIGFVPQEDIVYPDLTVKENLLYAGRLTLSAGTTREEISELADEVMASLGLSRIANSLVGDARRRGISGGEKKRVNVGIELMKKPKLLFLDEPTSGLDARAAFLVMESLQRLVSSQGMTVVAVIHQPRTDIYDMFDSLMLLGIGGRTVYHGPATKCKYYFENLGYQLKDGESQADWFLDISSGDIEMNIDSTNTRKSQVKMRQVENVHLDSDADIEFALTINSYGTKESDIEDREKSLPMITSNQDAVLLKSQMARDELYRQWSVRFETLSQLPMYNPPDAFPLPIMPKQVPGWRQLLIQLRRNSLLSWRNKDARLIDAAILIIAVFLITLLVGHNPDFDRNPTHLFWFTFIASAEEAATMLSVIFQYSMTGIGEIQTYCLMVAIIMTVLIGISATKLITEKQLQFFRESQSGVSVTAYYLAASITSTVEQGSVAILASVIAYLSMLPGTSILVYIWNFFMISWLSVSWALFLSLIVPPSAVTTVVGAWMAFFGLLFCGLLPPGYFNTLYNNNVLAVFAGFVSPVRFFVEGIAVSEAKCLPVQSGFPAGENAFNRTEFERSYPYFQWATYMGHTDLDGAQTFGCNGWYWWVGAAFAVGITIRIAAGVAIHCVGRAKQGKNPFLKEIVADFRGVTGRTRSIFQSFILRGILMFLVLVGFAVLSGWLILIENT
ncbi:hypothetical protein ACHAWT_002526 [Skeletonema menzelii]